MTELPWKPVVYLPATLTVSLGELVQQDGDPRPWCAAKAAALLGPDVGGRQVNKLAQCLAEYVAHFRLQRPLISAALFFYPDFTHLPPRATTKIEAFGEDSEKGPLTIAMMRELFEQPDELSFGQLEMTEAELPTGTGLRVHRYRRAESAKRRSRIGEELVWLIWPPASTAVISMATRWYEPMFSKAGITIADDMAQNFRTEPIVSPGALSRVGDRQDLPPRRR